MTLTKGMHDLHEFIPKKIFDTIDVQYHFEYQWALNVLLPHSSIARKTAKQKNSLPLRSFCNQIIDDILALTTC